MQRVLFFSLLRNEKRSEVSTFRELSGTANHIGFQCRAKYFVWFHLFTQFSFSTLLCENIGWELVWINSRLESFSPKEVAGTLVWVTLVVHSRDIKGLSNIPPISYCFPRNVQEMFMIKFQLKLRAGNDYSHQRGMKRFPQASGGSEADCATEQVAKVRRQVTSSWVGETEPISPSVILLTSKSGEVDWKESKPSGEMEWSRRQGH